MVDGDACSPAPISLHVDRPFFSKKRTIWLRVRFIRMFDIETGT